MAKYIDDAALQAEVEGILARIQVLEEDVAVLKVGQADHEERIQALEDVQVLPTVPIGFKGGWEQTPGSTDLAQNVVRFWAEYGATDVFMFTGAAETGLVYINRQGISYTDLLSGALTEARELGIRLWPCIAGKYLWRTSDPDLDLVTEECVGEHWYDFREARALSILAGLGNDLMSFYPGIAGVVGDYMRWSRFWMNLCRFNHSNITDAIRTLSQAVGAHNLTASPISIYGPGDATENDYHAHNYGQYWQEEWLGQNLMGWITPMVYNGLDHLNLRIQEWNAMGYIPEKTAPILSPCVNGDRTRPKSNDAWRAEIERVYQSGMRGFAVFDGRIMRENPAKMEILAEYWT